MVNKIGIISDTHGMLRPEVKELLTGCEMILHCGDINKKSILDELELIAPTFAVRGNNDREWAKDIPETRELDVFGIQVFMIHNKRMIPKEVMEESYGMDLILFGHSHRYEEKTEKGITLLNPGSCGPRRFHQDITMALMYIESEKGTYQIEKILIPHTDLKREQVPGNLVEKMPGIFLDISSGKSVKQISRKYRISEELSEEINRMYLTHPGIDVDGVLRRLGEKFEEFR